MDLPSRRRWYDYSRARDLMLKQTDTKIAPWYIVRSDDKRTARLNTIAHLLSLIPHKKRPPEKVKLPPGRAKARTTTTRRSRGAGSCRNAIDPAQESLNRAAAGTNQRRRQGRTPMKRLAVAVTVVAVLWASATGLPAGASQKPVPASQAAPAPKPEELDRLLAPIALYPDALLGQILLCAAEPSKVGALDEWLASQASLKGSALQDAAKASGFEESFAAIAIFPDVVNVMATQMDWTTKIGKAFTADRSAVFASIQRLRTKAQSAGKLKDTPQQDVETRTTSSGQQVIVIDPANPQVVYVPQYNPQTVYTTSTVVVQQEDNTAEAVAAGLIGFTAGIAIGAAIDNDYYYGPYGMHGGFYMYDDAWDDWYDDREDAREDWADHREDIVEERGDRANTAQEQRTDRQENRTEARPESQAQRTDRQQNRQEARPESQAQREQRRTDAAAASPEAASAARTSAEARGSSRDSTKTAADRSGSKSDAFSGYSSGKSQRAASSRGERSRSSSRSGGGSRRR